MEHQAHEIEHQSQYQNNNTKDTFEQLVQDAQMSNPDPYTTPDTLEYAAQQVENRANEIQNR